MWQFVLTDLAGTSLGEIRNASNRKVSLPLNRMVGGSFTVRSDHRRANEILTGDCLVKAYEDKTLRALGEIITAEEVADENKGTIAVTFGDALFRLLLRLIGKSATGYTQGTALAPIDRGEIMRTIIDSVQSSGPSLLPAPTGFAVTTSDTGFFFEDTTATFAVTAFDSGGKESLASTTQGATYPGPFANGAFNLSWNAVPGAVGYRVYRRTLSKAPAYGGNSVAPGKRTASLIVGTAAVDTGGYYYTPGDIPTFPIDAGGDAGIRIGNIESSSSTYVGPWYFQPAAERIVELAAALDGPDFEFVPMEPTKDFDGLALWTFNTYAAKGAAQPNAIFEFGTGKKNVKDYKRPVTKDKLMNFGYQLPPNFPDNATQSILSANDPVSISTRGRYESVVPSDLVVDELRQKLLEAHLRIRKVPRQVISFTPHAHNAPQFGVDYDVGDTVHFRAVRKNVVRVDGLFRVYGVDFDIDDNGNASTTLQVISDS